MKRKDFLIGFFGALVLSGLVIMSDQLTRQIEAYEEPTPYAGITKVITPVAITKSAIDTPASVEVNTEASVTKEPITSSAIKTPVKKKTNAQRVKELYTDEELDLIYKCVQCEAGVYDERWSKYSAEEYEKSQRLITDVILNMVDSEDYPNTVTKVISNHGRFSVYPYAISKCKVKKQIKKVVNDELLKHTNKKVMYFRSKHYHGFGKPYKNYAGSYFSTR